eukprot:10265_1
MIRTHQRHRWSHRRNRFALESPISSSLQCNNIRHFCIKHRVILYCSLTVLVLLQLHRNFIHESYLDRLLYSGHPIACSVWFGFIPMEKTDEVVDTLGLLHFI